MRTQEEIKEKSIEIIKGLKGWSYEETASLLGLMMGSFVELCYREKILNKK